MRNIDTRKVISIMSILCSLQCFLILLPEELHQARGFALLFFRNITMTLSISNMSNPPSSETPYRGILLTLSDDSWTT